MAHVSDGQQVTAEQSGISALLARIPLPKGNISRLLFEITVIFIGYVAYQLTRGVVEAGRVDDAFRNADTLIALERSLGIFWENQAQAMIVGHTFLIDFFNWIYIWGHLPVVGILALWVYFFRRPIFARYRNAFIISGIIGLCFFISVPMAPPRFITEAGFVDTITLHDKVYHALQAPGFVNQYAAMPSLHLGWNLLVGLAVFETAKVWFWKAFGLFMPIPMLAGIIFTGNHYFLDAVAGVAVALVALWLATMLNRMFQGTRIQGVLV